MGKTNNYLKAENFPELHSCPKILDSLIIDFLFGLELPQMALVVKNPAASAGDVKDMGLIPALGRSPGGGHGESHGQRSLVGYSP